ncbi:ubiquitin-like modifier-activating enzyme Atg7p [Trichomonascus vanleenenianus]|uniref:Atg7p n=1 Tax=Trichomonascus vanleenenianus TaxID=2268995 RepID=UPI003EC9FCEC
MSVKFAPFKSFSDAAFFKEFAERKLTELKLSEEKVAIHGTYAVPLQPTASPSISVSGTSFREFGDTVLESFPLALYAPGSLMNFNTIESFKQLDKLEAVRQEGLAIVSAIKNGAALNNPAVLNEFHVIAFSDLKIYKFYYWFCFPSITTEWEIAGQQRSVSPEEANALILAVKQFASTENYTQWPFFLAKKVGEQWVLARLSDHETFFEEDDERIVAFQDPSTIPGVMGWPMRNLLALIGALWKDATILSIRDCVPSDKPKSVLLPVSVKTDVSKLPPSEIKILGWERNSNDKLSPKISDLGSLIDPVQLADQAVDLNLKLMKWRIAPQLDLQKIKDTSCLLLGAGTLGSYIGRALLGWGVRTITFVDSGRVSYSNPVRQPLYTFKDCLNGGVPKAEQAAKALKEIYPSVDSAGHTLTVPMAGHPITNEETQKQDYDKLIELIDAHDVVFLLMDSRESRWLPSVIASARRKLVINAALGFDSYLVMRHGMSTPKNLAPHLGCYFCNDVVAPIDSASNQTLDQMCTVTRPGVAMLASSTAVELLVSVIQHPKKGLAPSPEQDGADSENLLGKTPHQIRGFLRGFDVMKIWGPSYNACSACSPAITQAWIDGGWQFVKRALNEPGYVEEVSGLKQIQQDVDNMVDDFSESD